MNSLYRFWPQYCIANSINSQSISFDIIFTFAFRTNPLSYGYWYIICVPILATRWHWQFYKPIQSISFDNIFTFLLKWTLYILWLLIYTPSFHIGHKMTLTILWTCPINVIWQYFYLVFQTISISLMVTEISLVPILASKLNWQSYELSQSIW